jgi:molybdate transport system regulatory protein
MLRYLFAWILMAKYIGCAWADNPASMQRLKTPTAVTQSTRIRLKLGQEIAIGPGKADVLESIEQTGSLAETGRQLGMSYQRVWSLVGVMNRSFMEPLVLTQRGGAAGGGAVLTPTGRRVLALYRRIEKDAQRAVAVRLPQLVALLRSDLPSRLSR